MKMKCTWVRGSMKMKCIWDTIASVMFFGLCSLGITLNNQVIRFIEAPMYNVGPNSESAITHIVVKFSKKYLVHERYTLSMFQLIELAETETEMAIGLKLRGQGLLCSTCQSRTSTAVRRSPPSEQTQTVIAIPKARLANKEIEHVIVLCKLQCARESTSNTANVAFEEDLEILTGQQMTRSGSIIECAAWYFLSFACLAVWSL
jgi:hypothetical protein